MLTFSPIAPVQYYEPVTPVPVVSRGAEHTFVAPERDPSGSQKRFGRDRQPESRTPDQSFSGLGSSATLLSSALLAELGRQASVNQDARKETDIASERRQAREDVDAEGGEDATGARQGAAADPLEGRRQGPSARNVVPGGAGGQPSSGPPVTTGANDDSQTSGSDQGSVLVRRQRAAAVYSQGQMASGTYGFARAAELFQLVA